MNHDWYKGGKNKCFNVFALAKQSVLQQNMVKTLTVGTMHW